MENVLVAWPRLRSGSGDERKTRAKPGAGTGMEQVLAEVSQVMEVTLRVPRKRPSTVNGLPRV